MFQSQDLFGSMDSIHNINPKTNVTEVINKKIIPCFSLFKNNKKYKTNTANIISIALEPNNTIAKNERIKYKINKFLFISLFKYKLRQKRSPTRKKEERNVGWE